VCRKVTDFCRLIVYATTLLKKFIGSKIFVVESLGSFKYSVVSSENGNNLTYVFSVYISYFCFTILRVQALYLIRMERVDTQFYSLF
jgi:hypothetical protein